MLMDEGGTACECWGHTGNLNERPFFYLLHRKTSNAEHSAAAINYFSAV